MDPAEQALFRRLRIRTLRRVDALFAGEYHSAFRGYGLLFDGVREYLYGDDIRTIDWNVSARTNHLYVKEFIEERELSVVLAVDVSASIDYGTVRKKREPLLEAIVLLVYLARVNNDRVSALLFTDRVEEYLPPRKGRGAGYALYEKIAGLNPSGRSTDISVATEFLGKVLKKRSVIFVMSDFLDCGDHRAGLRQLARRHDVVPVVLSDPAERSARYMGLSEFVDMETGRRVLTETVDSKTPAPDLEGFETIELGTELPAGGAVLEFLKRRARAKRPGLRAG